MDIKQIVDATLKAGVSTVAAPNGEKCLAYTAHVGKYDFYIYEDILALQDDAQRYLYNEVSTFIDVVSKQI